MNTGFTNSDAESSMEYIKKHPVFITVGIILIIIVLSNIIFAFSETMESIGSPKYNLGRNRRRRRRRHRRRRRRKRKFRLGRSLGGNIKNLRSRRREYIRKLKLKRARSKLPPKRILLTAKPEPPKRILSTAKPEPPPKRISPPKKKSQTQTIPAKRIIKPEERKPSASINRQEISTTLEPPDSKPDPKLALVIPELGPPGGRAGKKKLMIGDDTWLYWENASGNFAGGHFYTHRTPEECAKKCKRKPGCKAFNIDNNWREHGHRRGTCQIPRNFNTYIGRFKKKDGWTDAFFLQP